MPSPINPSFFPQYIYGLHDLGGQDRMLNANRPGWILDTVDLQSQTGTDYSALTHSGIGVLVRLNNGYDMNGTIPPSNRYDAFAAKCAAYVQNSPGAHIWLIGNEMNISAERPQLPDGTREVITADKYTQCFIKCRTAIKNVPGHTGDLVVTGAPGPYNAETGDWVQYLVDILNRLGTNVDGIALHTYTHDFNVDQISSEDMMGAPFQNRHFNFRAYRDYMNAIPSQFRSLPVFITETNPYAGWHDSSINWIQNAYAEINAWNADNSHQPIQSLILFRWFTLSDHPEWGLQNKPALINDFQAALNAGYQVRLPTPPAPPPPPPAAEYRAEWKEVIGVPDNKMQINSTLSGRVLILNRGSRTWQSGGTNPVRLGYHWYDTQGTEVPVALYTGNFSMTGDTATDGTASFANIELRAPQNPGTYTLKWDLVHEGISWFSTRGSKTKDLHITIVEPPPPPPPPAPDPWSVLFISHDTPVSERAGQSFTVNLRLMNLGGNTWAQNGNNPVHIGYKWFDINGNQVLDVDDRRTALPSDIAPKQQVALGALLAAPKTPGQYNLRWDLVAEGITWFADAGNPPLVVPVTVTTVPIDVSGWRTEASHNSAEVAHALDGDARTFWDSSAPQTLGQWFRLNLGSPRIIDGVQFLSPGRGFPAGYTLRISPNGMPNAWKEIARIGSNNRHDVMAVFSPQQVQYLQIDLLATASSTWMISEILVHTATQWTANASHNAQNANLAIDNLADTAWTSETPQAVGMWFQIDLGRMENISGIMLDPLGDENPTAFRITTWNAAASRWQIAYEQPHNTAPVDVVFTTAQTQFINVQITAPSAKPWSIARARVIREMETWLGPSRPGV